MLERQATNLQSVVQRFADDPLLSDFVAPFPNVLTRGPGDLSAGFARIAKLVGLGHRAAFIRFTITDEGRVRRWY